MKTTQDYADMQKKWYDERAPEMIGNHAHHNDNEDYWGILLGPIKTRESFFKGKRALDFGCGHGRNIINLLKTGIFDRVDGVDISSGNLDFARRNLLAEFKETQFQLFESKGMDLQPAPSDEYAFVMSTITLQHICCYSTRLAIIKDIYRVLQVGGVFSFQMGYGPGHPHTASYQVDEVNATSTNSGHDVQVLDHKDILTDLKTVGFVNPYFEIRRAWSDSHQHWIYVRCVK